VIIFDYETGGLTDAHPNIQLAAIAVDEGFQEVEALEMKIQFNEAEADSAALAMNHYDPERWKVEAVPEEQATRKLAEMCRRWARIQMVSKAGKLYQVSRLCGHNAAGFDGPRLWRVAKWYGIFLPAHPVVLDTVQLAAWSGRFASLKLTDIANELGIDSTGAHDALADVRLCAAVARKLKPMMAA
jgi:exonuclease I